MGFLSKLLGWDENKEPDFALTDERKARMFEYWHDIDRGLRNRPGIKENEAMQAYLDEAFWGFIEAFAEKSIAEEMASHWHSEDRLQRDKQADDAIIRHAKAVLNTIKQPEYGLTDDTYDTHLREKWGADPLLSQRPDEAYNLQNRAIDVLGSVIIRSIEVFEREFGVHREVIDQKVIGFELGH